MRRSMAAVVMTAALAASMVAFSAGPAFAGLCNDGNASNAPDLRYRVNGQDFEGGGQYPFADEPVVLGPGQSASIEVQWRNKSGGVATIRTRGFAFLKDPGMRIKVFFAGQNISATFRSGGLAFKGVAANDRTGLLEIRLKNTTNSATTSGQQGVWGHYKGAASAHCDQLLVVANQTM
jgi:hypothetical protein